MIAVEKLAANVGTALACEALDVPRAALYRRRSPRPPRPRAPCTPSREEETTYKNSRVFD